ncbi:putative acyl-CoA thioesterase 2-like [Cocos nucifera]|nr:putative acyl-CoA thioesterase 2-like [Cocos nucifera]
MVRAGTGRFSLVRGGTARLKYWFRARGKLSDDPALHRLGLYIFKEANKILTELVGPKEKLGILGRIWFHRPVRADDWLLYVIESPTAYGGRGFCTGSMFNQKGELIMSLTQEALIRKAKSPNQIAKAKL